MESTKKKRLSSVLAVVLVLTLVIGTTLAYLFGKTDAKENCFTFADNIKGVLTEPSWNPEDAVNLVPGKEIPKDPQVKNTSENSVEEYAAIKLTFVDGAGNELKADDMTKLMSLIEIQWSKNWTIKSGTATSSQQIYVYDKKIPQNITSDPVFYSVNIPSNITPENLSWLAGDYGHEDTCYTEGVHDEDLCEMTLWHHEMCKTNTGGECSCTASEVHEPACSSLIKNLNGTCEHKTIVGGLGNFTIKVEGAVVQADAFKTIDEAGAALISLFE